MTPNDPEFWPASMTRDGDTATRAQMHAAFEAFIARRDGRDASFLASVLLRKGAGHGLSSWPCARLADAMLQRARRAGHIHYDGREWREGPKP